MTLFNLVCVFGMAFIAIAFLIIAYLGVKKTKGWRYSGYIDELSATDRKAAIISFVLLLSGFGLLFFAAAFIS